MESTEREKEEEEAEDTHSGLGTGNRKKAAKYGIVSYYFFNLLATCGASTIAVAAWSTSMGAGKEMCEFLEDLSLMVLAACVAVACLLIVVLYLLDFFYPPHLPGQLLRLWEGDAFVGRGLLGLAGLALLCSVLLMTPTYPSIPVVVFTFVCPLSVAAVHLIVRPGAALPKGELLRDIVEKGDVRVKMDILKGMLGSEKDQLAFYKGATGAFITNFGIVLPLWIIFGVAQGKGKAGVEEAVGTERDKIYIQWATPLIVAISNLVFALFGLLRVFMQNSYNATDVYRNRLIADTMTSSLHDELLEYELALHEDMSDATKETYLNRHVQHIKQLSMLVKVVGVIFVLVIGGFYVVGQLLYANSAIAFMVLALLGAFFVLFLVFVSVAFSRILWAMGQWLQDLPAWKALRSVAAWSSIRAFFVCILLPAVPVLLLLSFLNQLVRRCRGLDQVPGRGFEQSFGLGQPAEAPGAAGDGQAAWEKGAPPAPSRSRHLTQRVAVIVEMVRQWPFLEICRWCYFFCGLYVLYNVFPLLLNVGLSWLRTETEDKPYALIVGLTFTIGIVAFLLPPVPGMTVYIFGGLVLSGTCPWGFWPGTVINIGMCWFLKLVACAIQQKCIGGMLGRSLWVRRTVCVHRLAIRCMEAELKVKGWTAGKVAILCGGPDWPTSVIAGVLGLSLWECEIGTIPIIGFVLPCALTGSLYLRKDMNQIYSNAADMMIVASVVVNLLLWAVAFWAIQNRLEADYEDLTRKLPENVDLHWLDHKEERIAERVATSWTDLPKFVRSMYLLGAAVQIIVCDFLTFGYSFLFGGFQVQDRIEDLILLPSEGQTGELFTWYAIMVLVTYLAAFLGMLQYRLWLKTATAATRREAGKELDTQEAAWKEAFLNEVASEEAARKLAKSGGTAPPPQMEAMDHNDKASTSYLTADDREGSGHNYVMVVPHKPS